MALNNASKVMTAKEDVSRFVKNGDSVITGNYTEALPRSLIVEIMRQREGLPHRYCTASADTIRAGAFAE